MNTHAERLAELKRRGWVCEHPDARLAMCPLKSAVPRYCVVVEGKAAQHHGVQMAYLARDEDLVMICGVAIDTDVAGFLRWIETGEAKEQPAAKALPGQRSLFD